MRGISEERLKEYANKLRVSNNPDRLALIALLDILIDECQELDDGGEVINDHTTTDGADTLDALVKTFYNSTRLIELPPLPNGKL